MVFAVQEILSAHITYQSFGVTYFTRRQDQVTKVLGRVFVFARIPGQRLLAKKNAPGKFTSAFFAFTLSCKNISCYINNS